MLLQEHPLKRLPDDRRERGEREPMLRIVPIFGNVVAVLSPKGGMLDGLNGETRELTKRRGREKGERKKNHPEWAFSQSPF